MSFGWSLLAGLAAGAVHALSGPDHLAAVAPLGAQGVRGAAWRVGASWGAGHAVGVALLAVLALLARDWLEPAWASAWGERLVGLGLIAIGAWGLGRATGRWAHSHPHRHAEGVHAHIHLHRPGGRREVHSHSHASLAIGALHGIAGGSHLLGILPALAVPGDRAALGYVAGFSVGTVAAMAAFAALAGRLASVARARGPGLSHAVLGACSLAAILVGVFWLV